MLTFVSGFLLGSVAGLRSMTAPAVASWAARMGWLELGESKLSFLGSRAAAYILTLLAIGELITDKLPQTPSRTDPGPLVVRIASGALSGGAAGANAGDFLTGALAGAAGAVAGTLGGYEARTHLTKAAGHDLPIALLEDGLAIGTAVAVLASK